MGDVQKWFACPCIGPTPPWTKKIQLIISVSSSASWNEKSNLVSYVFWR
jgi:hypothetical protein